MKRLLVILISVLAGWHSAAQVYRVDAGLTGGISSYLGDANQVFLKNPGWDLSLIGRYHFDTRFALRFQLETAGISGSTVGHSDEFVNGVEDSFRRRLVMADVGVDFDFFEYGAPGYYPGASRLSPYVSAGVGIVGYQADRFRVTATVPLAIGLKYKVADRCNIGLELLYRLTFSDRLDHFTGQSGFQLDDPLRSDSRWNKNNDHVAEVKLFVTYDLFYRGSTCYKEK